MELNEQMVIDSLEELGVIVKNCHVVLSSGRHSNVYLDKHQFVARPRELRHLCQLLSERFADEKIETVIGLPLGGALMALAVAYQLSVKNETEVFCLSADKEADSSITLREAFRPFVRGRRVLLVDDVLTTGSHLGELITEARLFGGEVVAAGVIWNRGGVEHSALAQVPQLVALVNQNLPDWSEAECRQFGPCSSRVPIQTGLGYGIPRLAAQPVL